jgi:hypothetical protein
VRPRAGGAAKCSQHLPHDQDTVCFVLLAPFRFFLLLLLLLLLLGHLPKCHMRDPPPPRYYCARQVEQQGKGGAECTLRQLRVTCTTTGSTHTLSHHHFHAWPDHGTPSSSSGIRAICRELAPARASGHPILVHCSAVSVCQQRVVDALQLLKHWPGTSNNLVL